MGFGRLFQPVLLGMLFFLFCLGAPGISGLGSGGVVQAQALPSAVLGGSASTEEEKEADPVARVVDLAAEAGLGIIIVDGSGQLVPTGSETAEGALSDGMEGASVMMKAQAEMQVVREAFASRLEALPYSIFEMKYVLRQTSPTGEIWVYFEVLFWSVLLLLVGRWAATEIYGKRIARRVVVSRIQDAPEGYLEKMPFLVFRFFMGIGGTIFAMICALLISIVLFGTADDTSVEFTFTAVFTAFFLARTVSDLWRMVLSPYLSQYRIPVLSDRDAKRLYIWASVLATYDISATIFATWVGDFGLNYNVYALVSGILSLGGLIGYLALVGFNFRAISGAIRAGRPPEQCSWIVRVLSWAWAPALMIYVTFGWINLAFDLVLENDIALPVMAGTYLVLTSIFVVYGVINYGIEVYSARRRGQMQRPEPTRNEEGDDPLEGEILDDMDDELMAMRRRHPISTFEELARRVAGILAFLVGGIALVFVWNPDIQWMENSLLDRTSDVLVILFIGYIIYHMARIWIDSKIDEEIGDAPVGELGDEGGAGGASRLATLLPLFRGAILAVVLVSIVLIVLLEAGINVSPLFAGAGVVGLAVGFGSQTLVRDIFSGAFFLVDDAFRKGEYIDIGDVKGTVEKISVRSFQLRHHLGALHTIPFGEIRVLTNYSRDWVIMKLPLRVTYDTDVEKVRKLIKKLGQELLSDPVIGESFIQPLKSQGVIEMQDSAMIIRVKFMTKPGDQWLVRKKAYEEIRQLFEREGIKFAHREVTVRLAEDQAEQVTPKQKEAMTGAVQAAIDEDMLDLNDSGLSGDDR